MGMVWNPTKETVTTKMQGNWFTFKPDMKKRMDDEKCKFITQERKETGLVILPAQFDGENENYIEGFEKTPEGVEVLEKLRNDGINNLLDFHRTIIRNNQVSLRRDMAHRYPDGDSQRLTMLEMSPGELKSLELVAKYQKEKQDKNAQKIKEINELLEIAGPIGD